MFLTPFLDVGSCPQPVKSGFVLPSPYPQEKMSKASYSKMEERNTLIKAVVGGRGGKNPANSGVCVASTFSASAPPDECRK